MVQGLSIEDVEQLVKALRKRHDTYLAQSWYRGPEALLEELDRVLHRLSQLSERAEAMRVVCAEELRDE